MIHYYAIGWVLFLILGKTMSENKCLCNLCFPNGKEIGPISPFYWFCKIDEKYVILGQPGHKGHILYAFEEVPYACPCPYTYSIEKNEEEEEKWYEVKENFDLDSRWTEEAERFASSFKVCPAIGYEIIEDCKTDHKIIEDCKTGYKYDEEKHGNFSYWLFNLCGKMLEKEFLNNLLEPLK